VKTLNSGAVLLLWVCVCFCVLTAASLQLATTSMALPRYARSVQRLACAHMPPRLAQSELTCESMDGNRHHASDVALRFVAGDNVESRQQVQSAR
jgi:hypothetical protein